MIKEFDENAEIIQKTCPQCNNNEAYIFSDSGNEIEYECAQCHDIFIENFTPHYYDE